MKRSKFLEIALSILIFNFAFLVLHPSSHALDVKKMMLDNGLKVLVVERHKLPVVMVTVGIKAGSLIEPENKAGLANLVAELLTAGTERRTASEINEEIEFVGGSLGASGGNDYITVTLSILKKDISLGFDLLSDIILNPTFPNEELKKKINRIKGSLKAREEDPGYIASKAFLKEVFGSHPYGRLIEGTEESLNRIERSDLLSFHRANYAPNNSIMSVVGNITLDEVKRLLREYFSNWRYRDIKSPAVLKTSNKKKKKTIIIDKELTQANIILGHIGVSRDNTDYYAISVMNYILGGGGFASRLMQNIREDKGLVYDIYSFFNANKYGGSFQISFQTKNSSANIAIGEVLKEIKRIRSMPVSDTELRDAKAFLTGSFPMRIETSRRIANFLVAVEYYGLGINYIDKYPGYINSVTKEDVLKVAREYLDPENFILVVVADKEEVSLKENFQ